jgi:hypothetical protein
MLGAPPSFASIQMMAAVFEGALNRFDGGRLNFQTCVRKNFA